MSLLHAINGTGGLQIFATNEGGTERDTREVEVPADANVRALNEAIITAFHLGCDPAAIELMIAAEEPITLDTAVADLGVGAEAGVRFKLVTATINVEYTLFDDIRGATTVPVGQEQITVPCHCPDFATVVRNAANQWQIDNQREGLSPDRIFISVDGPHVQNWDIVNSQPLVHPTGGRPDVQRYVVLSNKHNKVGFRVENPPPVPDTTSQHIEQWKIRRKRVNVIHGGSKYASELPGFAIYSMDNFRSMVSGEEGRYLEVKITGLAANHVIEFGVPSDDPNADSADLYEIWRQRVIDYLIEIQLVLVCLLICCIALCADSCTTEKEQDTTEKREDEQV